MPGVTNKPVIFLAFANDRDDTIRYLRDLPVERLSKVLDKAEQDGLCEVVVKPDCTASEIFDVFQDARYRNRIAVFHYGGHANGYQLLLESPEGKAAAADAGGLAAFLAQQQGLQLVFLNGCSTQQQTCELLDANIAAVISTSRSIDDQVATDFAYKFYQGLAGGATIRTSYHEAEASVQTAKGSNTRALYFGDKDNSQAQLEADRWPWNLYLREGSESADQWNLPEAVNDPLFGLPSLPQQDLPESPYRHLNRFTRKDADVFFGRGHQIRELYDRLTASRTVPIILLYGQSGVGKSSILDAGLIPRLERDHEVRYLRRTAEGLLDTLRSAFLPEASGASPESAWRVKEEQLDKPLIVFLDQVEELYTRPLAELPDELNQLLKVIKATFVETDRRPRGKLVLGFRKEWLAELEEQLSEFELPRNKVFLEPLDRRGMIEVVQGPTRSERLSEQYGLTIKDDDLAEIIADDLLDSESAIAPTLQILLTKMWTKAKEENYQHPCFSQELYQKLKRKGVLLGDFLNQQIAAFREPCPEAVDSGLLLDILALHTTSRGTANECTVEKLQQQYAHVGAALPGLLQKCQDLHLLTVPAGVQEVSTRTTRLAHDTLAPLVREEFDKSDKPGQRARRILDNRSVDWQGEQVGTPLDRADLKVVERGKEGTRVLSSTEQRLVEASRSARDAAVRRRYAWISIGIAAIIVIVALAFFGWGARGLAIKQRNLAIAQKLAISAPQVGTRFRDDEAAALVACQSFRFFERSGLGSVSVIDQSLRSVLNRRMFCIRWQAHPVMVHSVALNSNASMLASVDANGEVRLFDLSARPISRLAIEPPILDEDDTREGDTLTSRTVVEFSSDDCFLFLHVGGCTVLYDVTNAMAQIQMPEPIRRADIAGMSGDGSRIVVIRNKVLSFYDTKSSPISLTASCELSIEFARIAVSPDGRAAAGLTRDDVVEFWSVNDGTISVKQLREASENRHIDFGTGTIAFSPDGQRLLASGYAKPEPGSNTSMGRISMWDLTMPHSDPIEIPESALLAMSISSDSRWLVTGSAMDSMWANLQSLGSRLPDTTAVYRVYDLDNPAVPPTLIGGEEAEVTALAHSANDEFLVTGNMKGILRLWEWQFETASSTVTRISDGHLENLPPAGTVCPAGSRLLVCDDRRVRLFDTVSPGPPTYIQPVFLDDDNPDNVKPAEENMLRPIQFESGGPVVEMKADLFERLMGDVFPGAMPTNPGATVFSAAASTDGKSVVIGCFMGTVLWDRVTNTWKGLARGNHFTVSVAISSGGKTWSSADLSGTIRTWRSGQPVLEFTSNTAKWISVAISPDGQQLAAISIDGQVALWQLDVVSPKPVFVDVSGLPSRQNHILGGRCVVFSHDGKTLAASTTDNGIAIVNVSAGPTVARHLSGPDDVVTCIAFHPSQSKVVAGSRDGLVRLWNTTEDDPEPLTIEEHQNGVIDVAFLPDGDFVYSVGMDRNVRKAPASTGALVEIAEQKVRRNLTQEEWTMYVGRDIPYEGTIRELPLELNHGGASP